jgi:hypothetical protein
MYVDELVFKYLYPNHNYNVYILPKTIYTTEIKSNTIRVLNLIITHLSPTRRMYLASKKLKSVLCKIYDFSCSSSLLFQQVTWYSYSYDLWGGDNECVFVQAYILWVNLKLN